MVCPAAHPPGHEAPGDFFCSVFENDKIPDRGQRPEKFSIFYQKVYKKYIDKPEKR